MGKVVREKISSPVLIQFGHPAPRTLNEISGSVRLEMKPSFKGRKYTTQNGRDLLFTFQHSVTVSVTRIFPATQIPPWYGPSWSRGMGPWTKEWEWPLETGKGNEADPALEFPERNAAMPTPWLLAQRDLYWTSALQSHKIINLWFLRPLSLWQFVTTLIGN